MDWITSRNVKFDIRAASVLSGSNGEFATNVPASSINFIVDLVPSGTIPGGSSPFGNLTSNSYNFNAINGLTFSTMLSNPVVASFNGLNIYSSAIPTANIYTKSVKLNIIYTLPPFSLSQGQGSLDWKVNFTFWRK